MVQLAQERHRSATLAHCGLSNWASSRSCRPAVGTGSPMVAATLPTSSAARNSCPASAAAERKPCDEVRSFGSPGPDHEPLVELGEHEVVATANLGPGAHRGAEAGRGRRRAVDGHDEGVPASGAIVLIGIRAAEEDPVLDAKRSQLAGADADEGQLGRVDGGRLEADGPALAPPDVERDDRGERPALGTQRAHGVVEDPAISVTDQAVVTRRLLVTDPGRQVVLGGDLGVGHGPVENRGADDGAAVLAEEVQQEAEVGPGKEPRAAPVPRQDRRRWRRDGRPGRARVRGVGQVFVAHHGWASRRPHSSCANRSSSWRRVADRRRPTAWSTRG